MSKLLVVNIGSTSYKFKFFSMPDESELASGIIERISNKKSPMSFSIGANAPSVQSLDTSSGYSSCINAMIDILLRKGNQLIDNLEEINAIGFKTAHGGSTRGPSLIDDSVLAELDDYSIVVPAHNPPYIKAIRQFKELLPQIPLVAVFETAFHKDMPDYAFIYSTPYEWYQEYQIRRYGFHGASHRFATERACQLLNRPPEDLKMITCHLGGSSSISAIKHGKSVDNSLGFSCQTGLPMSNRSGDIDPFIIPYVMKKGGLSLDEVMESLLTKSGLLGMSEISSDVRDLETAAKEGNSRAALALKVYAYNIKKYIGAYAAVLGGLDVLIFTGGIGQNSWFVRCSACDNFAFLGLELDQNKNRTVTTEAVISSTSSRVKVLVIPANEEIIVARETLRAVQKLS